MIRSIKLEVNGQSVSVEVDERLTLADALRDELDLTGTHLACEHGVCGACTVLVDNRAVRSCLMFAIQCEQSAVMTIEGLTPSGDLHPLQQAFKNNHALQCGFCTPGFVMLAHAALLEDPNMKDAELEEWLSSNLCRCTGYKSILAAVKEARDAAAMAKE